MSADKLRSRDDDPSGRALSPVRKRSLAFFRVTALWEAFLVALGSLRQNKLRTALTLVGIVVGVAAVIAVVTIIQGLDNKVATTFSSQGSTVFSISKRPQIIRSREEFIKFNKRKDVRHEDADAVARLCSACWRVGEAANARETLKHGDQKFENVNIRGVSPTTMFDIDGRAVDAGRVWTDSEGISGREICVVGPDVLTNLFGGASADRVIGQEVRIAGRPFQIIGVLEPLGSIFGASRDSVAYIPYATYQKVYGARDSIVIFIQVPAAQQLEVAEDQVRTIMRNRRGGAFSQEDDEGFSLETQDVFLDLYGKATSNIYLVTIGVAAISLVVGGIVVMNIMLVSVTERTKEIGIRKAIGARRKDILTQFLIEAVMVTAIGGAIGVLTGFGLAYLIAALIGFPLLMSVGSAILGVGVSSVVGIVSGLWPAWRAARLDPIEALRAE
ncbi:MAG: putative transport system permease protein [Pyrinomonadaceae bacterium]|jgi:putative ABC transport system permease protein|nr:putative transport system permease protein [Pyrinomonadaceae bacterium]